VSRPRVLVAGTADAIEALVKALQGAADVVPARSVKQALAELDRGPFDTIACNIKFDESRMFEFLQAVMDRKLADMRIVAFRADDSALTSSTRKAIRNALEALGVERFADLSQLRAEYGEDVALETLRKMGLDDTFVPPAPSGN
jgi:PleD family two-component response regulator